MADVTITPANVLPSSGGGGRGTVSTPVLAGEVVAFDATGKITQADANGTPPVNIPIGIAVCSAPGIGQSVLYTSSDPNFACGGTVINGTPYFLSGNPGKFCPAADLTSGMTSSLIGWGKGTTALVLSVQTSGITI